MKQKDVQLLIDYMKAGFTVETSFRLGKERISFNDELFIIESYDYDCEPYRETSYNYTEQRLRLLLENYNTDKYDNIIYKRKLFLAQQLVERKDYEKAIKSFEKIIKQYKNCALSIIGIGLCHFYLNDKEKAKEHIKKGLDELYYGAYHYFFTSKNYIKTKTTLKQSIEFYDLILKLIPNEETVLKHKEDSIKEIEKL